MATNKGKKSKSKNQVPKKSAQASISAPETSAYYGSYYSSQYYVKPFNGEKNTGEMGPPVSYIIDHRILALRAWKMYLETDIAKIVLNRFFIWVVNRGLKLQCEPAVAVLASEGINNVDTESFNTLCESRFNIFSSSKKSSFNGMLSLNEIAKEVYKCASITGDCLVIQRYVKGQHTVEMIDGVHLTSPLMVNVGTGNKVINGVEVDESGRHIAYHVRNKDLKIDRVEAWSKSTGLRMAFLVYGSKYRLDDYRGLPRISTSMETLDSIDRYKMAAVGSAEERAKIVLAIEHNAISDGSSPLKDQLATMYNADNLGLKVNPVDAAGNALASQVAATTGKQTFNMTPGSKMSVVDSKQELFFKEFYETNAHIVCAAVGIPPNVAFSIYNDSFSASRAATKDWENTIEFERDDLKNQFYDPIFAFWLHIQVSTLKINAPGYLAAFNGGNWMVTESYLNSRFVGPMFPHIDPVKEATAERLKLGTAGAHLPLTTQEAATAVLSGSESRSNTDQFARELAYAEKLNIDPVSTVSVPESDNNDSSDEYKPKKKTPAPPKPEKKAD